MPIFAYLLLAYCSLLVACSERAGFNQSDSDSTGLYISGSVSPAAGISQDSDINDSLATYRSNDSPTQPQLLTSTTVQGFASAQGTGGNVQFERFANQADHKDYYQVTLQAGQRVQLTLALGDGQSYQDQDLDLFLLNSSNATLESSMQQGEAGKTEEVTAPADGDYLILVEAAQGHVRYLLQLLSAPAHTQALPITEFVSNEALVRYKKHGAASARHTAESAVQRVMLPTTQRLANTDPLQSFNPQLYEKYRTLKAIKALNQDSDVLYAEPNYLRQILQTPNDPFYYAQWHYPQINLPSAWDYSTGSNVVVAVLDSGVFLEHPDLKANLIAGYDFISSPAMARDGDGIDANPDDPGDSDLLGASSWHGTHASGTVAAVSNNNLGIAGVASSAKLMPLRVLGKGGGSSYDIAQAIYYAAGLPNDSGTVPAQKADIISMSFGSLSASQSEQAAIDAALQQGLILVAAAGNSNSDRPFYPAAYQTVIGVSATGPAGSKASYSNYGPYIDLAAPGGDQQQGVLSTFVSAEQGERQPAYAYAQGTSMAAPHVAGVLALMKSLQPNLTHTEVTRLIQSCTITTKLGTCQRNDSLGFGQIDAFLAVQQILSNAPFALLSTNASTIVLSHAQPNIKLSVRNLGDLDASQIQISSNQSWLRVGSFNSTLVAQQQATLELDADLTGLVGHQHHATLTISYQDTAQSRSVSLSVVLELATASDGPQAPLYVLLEKLDCNTNDCPIQTSRVQKGKFTFSNLPLGSYRLYAGSDIDADNYLCQLAESCGVYPDSGSSQALELTQSLQDVHIQVRLNNRLNLGQRVVLERQTTSVQGLQKETEKRP